LTGAHLIELEEIGLEDKDGVAEFWIRTFDLGAVAKTRKAQAYLGTCRFEPGYFDELLEFNYVEEAEVELLKVCDFTHFCQEDLINVHHQFILVADPAKRPTMAQVMAHPYFTLSK
jgi:hypothetical protein